MVATTPQANAPLAYGGNSASIGLKGITPPSPEPLGEMLFLQAGAPLYHQEDSATHLYRVVSGSVRAFTHTEDGRRQVNAFHFSGDTFGTGQQGRYRSSAEAITECSLVRYRRHNPTIDHTATFDPFVLDVALAEIRTAEHQILLLGRMSACAKVAAFLLYLADRLAPGVGPGVAVPIPMTRYDIADFLGLSAESVSRCFTKLKLRGVIEMNTSDVITLADPDALYDIPRGF